MIRFPFRSFLLRLSACSVLVALSILVGGLFTFVECVCVTFAKLFALDGWQEDGRDVAVALRVVSTCGLLSSR